MFTPEQILRELENNADSFIERHCEHIGSGSYRDAYKVNGCDFVVKQDLARQPEFSCSGNKNEWEIYKKLTSRFPTLSRFIMKVYGVTRNYVYLLCEYIPNELPNKCKNWFVHNGRYYGKNRVICGEVRTYLTKTSILFHKFVKRAGIDTFFNDCHERNLRMRNEERVPVLIDLGNVDL